MAKKDTDLNVGIRSASQDDEALSALIADEEAKGNTIETQEDGSIWSVQEGAVTIRSRLK